MKTAAPPYVSAPKIAHDPIDISKLTIRAITPAFTTISAFMTFNPDPPVSPLMPARLTTLELRDEYQQTGRCVKCGLKDHWIKNYSLAPHNALAGTSTSTSKRVIIAAINDNNSGGSDLGNYNGTRSKLEAKVDKIVAEQPEID